MLIGGRGEDKVLRQCSSLRIMRKGRGGNVRCVIFRIPSRVPQRKENQHYLSRVGIALLLTACFGRSDSISEGGGEEERPWRKEEGEKGGMECFQR